MSASAEGGIKFGQYVLLRRIARGGMAEVFLAQQRGLEGFDRRVAVKRILPHLADAPDFVKMFLKEAQLAAQLTHPNIVHIYDFGKFDGDYFIAMEYVDGVHTGQLFKHGERERMPPTMVARIGADAAAALHYAHELTSSTGQVLGLVHRDVSPANVMVSFDGVVKLVDFGIAKAAALGDQLTNPGQVKGKYAYMSPEQTIASPLDGRSDVFSLSIVLWELLSGKNIVSRGDAVEAMRAIRDGKLPPIEKAAPWVPPMLARAITWGLQTKREQRATAMELTQALEAFIKSSPELATPIQLGAWVRQRFPRDMSGAHPALQPPGRGTQMSPGTVAAPGTEMSDPGTRVGLETPGPDDVPDDAADHAADDLDEAAETVDLSHRQAANAATVLEGDAGDTRNETITIDESDETGLRGGVFRPPEVGPAAVVPTQVAATPLLPRRTPPGGHAATGAPPARSSGPSLGPSPGGSFTDATLGLRRRASPRRRTLLAVGGLVALAVLSFVIALAARSCGSAPPRTVVHDAARVAVITADATATDASVAPLVPTVPTVPILVDAAAPHDATDTVILTVTTKPGGGTVRVGDQTRVEPAKFAMAPGTYTIIAEHEGYKPEKRAIELTAGVDLVQEIAFDRKTASASTRPAPPPTGKLTARTTPYSVVFNGGKRIGETPFADVELAAGTYTLTFKNPSREPFSRKVTISPGKTTKLSFALP